MESDEGWEEWTRLKGGSRTERRGEEEEKDFRFIMIIILTGLLSMKTQKSERLDSGPYTATRIHEECESEQNM